MASGAGAGFLFGPVESGADAGLLFGPVISGVDTGLLCFDGPDHVGHVTLPNQVYR